MMATGSCDLCELSTGSVPIPRCCAEFTGTTETRRTDGARISSAAPRADFLDALTLVTYPHPAHRQSRAHAVADSPAPVHLRRVRPEV
jgi:hypothetical protein